MDPMTMSATRMSRSVLGPMVGSHFAPTTVIKVGLREERREAYMRLLDALMDAMTATGFVNGLAAHRMKESRTEQHLSELLQAGNDVVRTLAGVRPVGSVPVISAAETAAEAIAELGATLGTNGYTSASANAAKTQEALIDACRTDLSYRGRWWQLRRRWINRTPRATT
ncbi:hypothetical protein ACIRL2_41215 [Embleya sp. NPDC127516]|uniref:hypothetical protein n=1 Tax=Embleya sp. NPDC127516 TaxID=3363990 RepID=UPI0037F12B41